MHKILETNKKMLKLRMWNERIPFFCFELNCIFGSDSFIEISILIYNNRFWKIIWQPNKKPRYNNNSNINNTYLPWSHCFIIWLCIKAYAQQMLLSLINLHQLPYDYAFCICRSLSTFSRHFLRASENQWWMFSILE